MFVIKYYVIPSGYMKYILMVLILKLMGNIWLRSYYANVATNIKLHTGNYRGQTLQENTGDSLQNHQSNLF